MIVFLFPKVLWALFLAAIPLIIHLINLRRYKKVYFSNTHILENIVMETRKMKSVRNLLILILRTLAILALVFAFAQPSLHKEENRLSGKTTFISVYVDNSFSMENVLIDQTLFDNAKRKALAISDIYGDEVSYQLMTNDLSVKSQQLIDKETFDQSIAELKVSSKHLKMDKVLIKQAELIQETANKSVRRYVLSDFQASMTSPNDFPYDSIPTSLIMLQGDHQNNLHMDTVWLESPIVQVGKQIEISVNLVNSGNNNLEKIPVRLFIDGQQRSISTVNISANSETMVSLKYVPLKSGIQYAELRIDDSPVVFDNQFYFVIEIVGKIKILDIHDGAINKYLEAVFQSDSVFSVEKRNIRQLNIDDLNQFDLIIIDHLVSINQGLTNKLKELVLGGTSLVILPSDKINLQDFRNAQLALGIPIFSNLDTVTTRLFAINKQHPIMSNIYEEDESILELIKINKQFSQKPVLTSAYDFLLSDIKNQPLLTETKLGRGKIYQFSMPLEASFSNLPFHGEIFVPALLNIGVSAAKTGESYFQIGSESSLKVESNDQNQESVLSISSIQNNVDFIPKQRNSGGAYKISFGEEIRQSGHYNVLNGDELVAAFAMNYSNIESKLEVFGRDSLKNILKQLSLDSHYKIASGDKLETELIKAQEDGNQLWYLLLILAILALISEQIILRWMH